MEIEQECAIRTFEELCKFIAGNVVHPTRVVETGTTFHIEPEGYDTYSTPNLVKWICGDSKLISLDIASYQGTQQVCEAMGVDFFKSVRLHVGDSVDLLIDLSENGYMFDVAHLDSAEDGGNHMMNEFAALEDMLAPEHYLMIDDIHNPSSGKYRKLVPWLLDMPAYECMQVPTRMGTFLAAKGLPLPRRGE